MGQEDFKEIGMTKAGPLALMLKEIERFCTKALFVEHNSYFFGKILGTLWLRSMCQIEKNLPSLYIQESHQEQFNKLVDYYFPGESALFILQGSDINSKVYPNIKVLRLRAGCWKMEYLEIWSSYIGAHGMDGRDQISIPSVTTRVQPLQ